MSTDGAGNRCPSINPRTQSLRCTLSDGHDGPHQLGGIAWPDPEPTSKRWPTDESVQRYLDSVDDYQNVHHLPMWEVIRDNLAAGMEADPIVKAAVELRDVIRSAVGPVGPEDARVVQAVIDAVNGAGL